MSDTPLALLDEADACHDDDPARAADLLRRLDPAALPAERWPGLAFLLNHVLGEKLGAWHEAHAMFGPLLRAAGEKPPLGAVAPGGGGGATRRRRSRRAAPERRAGGRRRRQRRARRRTRSRSPPRCTARRRCPRRRRRAAGRRSCRRLTRRSWQPAGPLDGAVAACANNIASGLLERPPAELRQAPLRDALDDTAAACRALLAARRHLGPSRARRLPARDGGQRAGRSGAGARARAARAGAARRARHRAAPSRSTAPSSNSSARGPAATSDPARRGAGGAGHGRCAGGAVRRRRSRRLVREAPRRTRHAASRLSASGRPCADRRRRARVTPAPRAASAWRPRSAASARSRLRA